MHSIFGLKFRLPHEFGGPDLGDLLEIEILPAVMNRINQKHVIYYRNIQTDHI